MLASQRAERHKAIVVAIRRAFEIIVGFYLGRRGRWWVGCILVGMVAEVMDVALTHQFAFLFLLALPVACVSWTVTHEEVFREPREYCKDKAQNVQAAGGAEVLLPVYV